MVCTPCRGTGQVISNLGGDTHRVVCPWCDGTGGYTLTAKSVSGSSPDTYVLTDTSGAVTRTCSGSGGGCPNGSW